MPKLIQDLREGPLDLIGDVHGEIEGLLKLLHRLGVDPEARTCRRPVVFVGDLVDRGPDSVAVVQLVARLLEAGIAQAILGNHELNLLLGDPKEGNGWFDGKADDHWQHDGQREAFDSRLATPAERDAIEKVIAEFPLALTRDDLRVVHACWLDEAVASLPSEGAVGEIYEHWNAQIEDELQRTGVQQRADAQRARFADLADQHVEPDCHLEDIIEEELARQLRNPVKVLTSGIEAPVRPTEHFFTGGRWRFTRRDPWWERAVDRPTVIGHYWRRRRSPETQPSARAEGWDRLEPFDWSGGVFCVDYSAGRRYIDRHRGQRDFAGGLAALRWPEEVVQFDDRAEVIPTRRGLRVTGTTSA